MTREVEPPATSAANPFIVVAPFHRRRAARVMFTSAPAAPKPEPVRRPAKVARMLALAHHIEDAIRRGAVADRAAVARELGFTRARITQLMDLLLLSPELQERVLFLEAVDGVEPLSERELREVVKERRWSEQRFPLARTAPGQAPPATRVE